jgi:transposase
VPVAPRRRRLGRFPEGLARALPDDVHAVLVPDGAGRHTSSDPRVPGDVTPARLPPHAPQLGPVERVWLYLRGRFLSPRPHAGYEAVADAACDA